MDIILPQIVSIGIYNTKNVFKNVTITKNRRVCMFEIELPIEDGGISYIGNTSAKIKEDRVIIAKPEQIRHTMLPFKCYYIHCIVTKGSLFEALIKMPNFIDLAKNKDKCADIFKKMIKYYNSGIQSDEIKLQSLVLELINLLIKTSNQQILMHKLSNNYNVVEQAIEYIKNNLSSDLSLETLSNRASFSAVHFHNSFKKATGKTLHKYVEEQRIKKAINLLLTTNMTLTEIAFECGFSSQAYFSFAFKRKTNLTPRDYVKQAIEKYGTDDI